MKYVSIDIETTGLNPDTCNTLEFGAVLEDTVNWKLLEELPTFRRVLRPPVAVGIYCVEPSAVTMHTKLFEEITAGSSGKIVGPSNAPGLFTSIQFEKYRYSSFS